MGDIQEDKLYDEILGEGLAIVDDDKIKIENNKMVEDNNKTDDNNTNQSNNLNIKDETKPENNDVKNDNKQQQQEEVVNVKTETNKGDESKTENVQDTKSDATLLITTEEELDVTNEKKEEKKDENLKNDEESKPKRKSGDVWVSNISRRIKATDLRKHFSKHGKVSTAKIVTNGRSFFGYILMENDEIANKCVKNLHGSILDGRKLSVTRQRPDSNKRSTTSERRPTTKKPVEKKKKDDEVKEKDKENKDKDKEKEKDKKESDKDIKDKDSKEKEKSKDKKVVDEKKERDKESRRRSPSKRDPGETIELYRRSNIKLKREIDFLRRELQRLKRFLTEEQRRFRTEQNKCRTLGRELQDMEIKYKEEKRKFDREREIYEKNARTDRERLNQDRSMMKKELEEIKKMREYLKRKMDEDQARSMERSRRASSPYGYGSVSKRFRDDEKSKYMEERTRTPPSPPKLSSRKRSPISSSFQMEKERRHHYDVSENYDKDINRHHGGSSNSMPIPSKPAIPAPPRNIWPNSFYQDVWRLGPGQSGSGSGGGGGGGGGGSGSSSSAAPPFSTNQYQSSRQSDYNSSGKSGPSYPPSRDFGKRDHYSGGSVRKY